MSVERSAASIKRGQDAGYTVRVSAENAPASAVTVRLSATPSAEKPAFTSGCAEPDGTASCQVRSVSDKQATELKAQIPVAASASSVTSVTLTAKATVVTSGTWTPPVAAETVTVTAAAATASPSATATATATATAGSPSAAPATLPLGPLPQLNSTATSLIGPGNAAGLFPTIRPSATAGRPAPGAPRASARPTDPVADSSAIAVGGPVLTEQVAGLIAIAVAVLLIVTRIAVRRRLKKR